MIVWRGHQRWLLSLIILVASSAPSIADAPIPVEKYAEIPLARAARLSPDGTKLALITTVKGQQLLLIHDLGGGNKAVGLGTYQARWVIWKSDTRLVAGVYTSTDALFQYGDMQQHQVTRLVAFDVDGSHLVNIGEPQGGYRIEGSAATPGEGIHPQLQDELVSPLMSDPHHVLQQVITDYPEPGVTPSVYLVDIDTGAHRRVERSHAHIWRYETDATGAIRLSRGLVGTDQVVYARDPDSAEGDRADWHLVNRGSVDAGAPFVPVAFVPDNPTQIYAFATSEGKSGLWTFDIDRGTPVTLVDGTVNAREAPDVRDGRLVSYLSASGVRRYLDPAWQRDLDATRKALKGKNAVIVDRTSDGSRTLIAVDEPHQPLSWWLLDRSKKPTELSPVIETYPDIASAGTATVLTISYKARDGLMIPGYITLPPSVGPLTADQKPAHPIPFVVLVHGGPWACDSTEGFDYEAQFLASRGWGVLQPEFRGSACFGAEFQQRGYRQWGFAMQDDVTDGTRLLIAQNLADPTRICIVGGSYGGYAALEGVVKEPDLYHCAAAWAPVTDLLAFKQDLKKNLINAVDFDRLGDDERRLDAASPARHADRIKVPVLLMHGKDDFTVQVRHSKRMESALKDAGKPVEAIYLDDADHYRLQYPARLAWLQALERFLTANLAPAAGGAQP